MEQVVTISAAHQAQIEELGITALYLFGSRATGHATARSDYDYAVLLPQTGHARGDELYQSLYEILTECSPRTLQNDVIDIVFLRDAPLELQCHVIRYGLLLLDTEPSPRLRFETETLLRYCDYRPILDQFDRTILQSL
ncbi:MAG: nucleotidyltransferase domain-containing protein [Deltaproteobacteria bacterium]|nr:nucleotidyltransferase domain-containing protein [Deltaproteobacteria bacterium]